MADIHKEIDNEVQKKFSIIDKKLKDAFSSVKTELKNLVDNSKKEAKTPDQSKEIERLKEELERRKKKEEIDNIVQKEKKKIVSLEGKLKKFKEKSELLKKAKKQEELLSKKYESMLNKASEVFEGNVKIIREDFKKSKAQDVKEKEMLLVLYESKLKEIQENSNIEAKNIQKRFLDEQKLLNLRYEKAISDFSDRINSIEESNTSFRKELLEFSKDGERKFLKAIKEIEKQREKDFVFILNSLKSSQTAQIKVNGESVSEGFFSRFFSKKKEKVPETKMKVMTIPAKKKDLKLAEDSSFVNKEQGFWKVLPYVFLGVLLLLAVNQYFNWTVVSDWNWQIVVLGIITGGLTFWKNRHKINSEMDDEKNQEELTEEIKKREFPDKFPRLNKIWGVRHVAKWMYGEGWYAWALVGIVILGFVLRIWNLASLVPFTDEYTHLYASKLLVNDGIVYSDTRAVFINYIIIGLFSLFNISWNNLLVNFDKVMIVARLPEVLVGCLTIVLTYSLVKRINKPLGIISAVLTAILPIHLSLSKFIREYIYFYAVFLIVLIIIFRFFDKKKLTKIDGLIFVLILAYSFFDYLSTLKTIWVIYALFFVILILNFLIKKSLLKPVTYNILAVLGFLGIILTLILSSLGSSLINLSYLKTMVLSSGSDFFYQLGGLAVILFVLGLFALVLLISLSNKKEKYFLILASAIGYIIFFVVIFNRYWQPRYVFYYFIFWIITISLFYYSMGKIFNFGKIGRVVFVILLILLTINLPYVVSSASYSKNNAWEPATDHYRLEFRDPFNELNLTDKYIISSADFIFYLFYNVDYNKLEHYNYEKSNYTELISDSILKNQSGLLIVDWQRNELWNSDNKIPLKDLSINNQTIRFENVPYWRVYSW